MTTIPWRGNRRRSLLSVLEQLRVCQEAWCLGSPWDRQQAHVVLCGRPAGSFLVLKDPKTSKPNLLCVSSGGENKAVLDYHIKQSGTAFQLSQSCLGFFDVAQLILFYSLTRDVLSICLYIPAWLCSVTEPTTQLEPKCWLSEPPDLKVDPMTDTKPSPVMCSIQLTSANGALCVINPLYLHEHRDDLMTQQPTSPQWSKSSAHPRRLSSSRPWAGAGLQTKRAISLDQDSSASSTEIPSLIRAHSANLAETPPSPEPVVLRRPSRDFASCPPRRAVSQEGPSSPAPCSHSSPTGLSPVQPQRHSSPVPQSPHRVSWIEDGVWLPPPRPVSLLHPPSMDLDTLSISSIEEEQESQVSSPAYQNQYGNRLADKVKHRISAVGQAISGWVSPQKRLTNRVVELSERKGGVFAEAVKGFIEATLRGGGDPNGTTGTEFLQEVRSSLTALRETLMDCPEIQSLLDSMTDTPDWEMDSMVELSLHKVALKPVSNHIYASLQASRCQDGSLPNLRGNQRVLEERGVEDLGGSAGAGVPDPPTLERMQQRWSSMHAAYSPSKKVQILLKVCKTIYHSMSTNASPGVVFGADDFLPCLTWVLLRSDVATLQRDTDYMMELLDPPQLQGEGGYYLTSLYASLFYISSFRPRLASRQLSAEAEKSLNQWHRRRTLYSSQARRCKQRPPIHRKVHREAETGSEQGDESGGKRECVRLVSLGDEAESQQQTGNNTEALEVVREEVGDPIEPPSQPQQSLLGKGDSWTAGRSPGSTEEDAAEEKSVEDDQEKGAMEQSEGEEGKKELVKAVEHAAVHKSTYHHEVLWTKQLGIRIAHNN